MSASLVLFIPETGYFDRISMSDALEMNFKSLPLIDKTNMIIAYQENDKNYLFIFNSFDDLNNFNEIFVNVNGIEDDRSLFPNSPFFEIQNEQRINYPQKILKTSLNSRDSKNINKFSYGLLPPNSNF